jgi:hypothetical protein
MQAVKGKQKVCQYPGMPGLLQHFFFHAEGRYLSATHVTIKHMRKAFLVVVLFSLVGTAMAQKLKVKNVPPQALRAFKAAYPIAKKTVWKKEGEDFEVEFQDREGEISLVFNQAGILLEREREIAQNMVPPGVLQAVVTGYPGYKINEAAIIEKGNEVLYEVELNKGSKSLDLIFDQQGSLKRNAKQID